MDRAEKDIALLLKIRQLREDKAARSLAAAEAHLARALQEQTAAQEAVASVTGQVDEARGRHLPAKGVYITGAALKASADTLRSFKAILQDARLRYEDANSVAEDARRRHAERLSEFRQRHVSVIKTEATMELIGGDGAVPDGE